MKSPDSDAQAARDLIERESAFQEWAQDYLNGARWAGHDRSDAIKQELLERDWALDNIYTIAIREERYGGERARAWTHVRRVCERFGCAVRAVRPAGKDGEQKYGGNAEDAKAEAVSRPGSDQGERG